MDYKKAGVDIEAGYKAVELMKEHIAGTMRSEVLTDIGGFSGAFSIEAFKGMEQPTLVSGTDGVGTKLKLAFEMDRHDTVGIDCVAMCVNDIACAGGEPLFFLDYIACGKNQPEKIASIVSGVAQGCQQAGAALIGGETAEMQDQGRRCDRAGGQRELRLRLRHQLRGGLRERRGKPPLPVLPHRPLRQQCLHQD